MLLKLGKRRLVSDYYKDLSVAVTLTANGTRGVTCCCSAQERCLEQGCGFQSHMKLAIGMILKESGMNLERVLHGQEASVCRSSCVPGTAVRYGSGL